MSIVQNYAREQVIAQLKAKLNVNLGIESLHFQPFNTIELNNIYIHDQKDSVILLANKIYANVDILDLFYKKITVNTVRLSNFDVYLSKDSARSPLNIQFIIDAFKSKSPKSKTKFDVKLSAVILSEGNFHFDIKDRPKRFDKFDPNHINVSDLDARLALKSLKPDSLNLQIRSLSLKERSGFIVNNLSTRVITQNKKVAIKGFKLDLPKSYLKFNRFDIDLSKVTSSRDLLDYANFDLSTTSSYVALKDISAFVPVFKNFEDRIYFETKIEGSIDNLKMTDLSLDYGQKMHLVANAEVRNIRKPDQTYLLGSIDELQITNDGIEGIVNNFSENKKSIPKELKTLGTVSFRGDLSGYLKQLTAFGSFKTDLGQVTTDLLFGFHPNEGIDVYFNGKVSTPSFDLGKLTSQKDLNKLSFDLSINIQKPTGKKMGGKVKGQIHEFDYKNYAYKEIFIDGNYDGLKLDGSLSLKDENGFFKMDGLIDLSRKIPVLNFVANAKNVQLDKLNLSPKYPDSHLTFNVNANFTGQNIDDAVGSLSIDSLTFLRPDKEFFMKQLLINASGAAADRKLTVKSDIINGQVLGAYSFSTIFASLKKTASIYLPAIIDPNDFNKKKIDTDNLSLNFTINNTQKISDIFNLPVTVLDSLQIKGFYNNMYNKFRIEVICPQLQAGKTIINSGYFLTENTLDQINSTIHATTTGKNGSLNTIGLDLSAKNNVIGSKISFTNDGKNSIKATILASTTLARSRYQPLSANIDILPSQLLLRDTVWNVEKSNILIDSSYLAVHQFSIKSLQHQQSINIDGRLSRKNPNDILHLNLKNINLSYVFDMLNIPALNFGGYASGGLAASSIDGKIYTNVNLKVKNFAFNNSPLGDLTLSSYLDNATNNVNLKGEILSDENKITTVDGFINPVSQEISIDFDADRISVGFLNKYVGSLFNNVSGRGSGHVRLLGDLRNVTVQGKAYIKDAKLGINTLNTSYSFSDSIFMKKDLIYFNNIKLNDQFGHQASVSGKVVHNYFANFLYQVDFTGKNFLVYNATKQINPTFNGTVYATGTGSLSGDEHSLDIDAHISTNKNTKVYMDFMENGVNTYSFLTYKSSKDSIAGTHSDVHSNPLAKNSRMKINMNFYVDATPDATVEMLMDPIGGDRIKGTGSGSMQFVWGTDTDPQLFGTYTINRGSYNFTFQKIFERIFSIENGSSVQFRGDPYGAMLNLSAVYKLTANLNDLSKDLVTTSGQSNVPVNCLMNITGELKHPDVKLDVQLPNADPEIQRQAKSIMAMDDQINRQVVYLLLLSKFYTPNYGNTDNTTNSFASVASATLSTQLGNLLNQIDPRFQVGTNIRTSDAQFTATEVELLLSSHLLNDRLIVSGNFGYREDPNLPASFIGDVDVQYLLTNTGNWSVKAYNHENDKYYLLPNTNGRAIQTQGIGLMYKKDFDKIGEFFNWFPRSKAKSIDSIPTPILPDSAHIGSSLGSFIKIKK